MSLTRQQPLSHTQTSEGGHTTERSVLDSPHPTPYTVNQTRSGAVVPGPPRFGSSSRRTPSTPGGRHARSHGLSRGKDAHHHQPGVGAHRAGPRRVRTALSPRGRGQRWFPWQRRDGTHQRRQPGKPPAPACEAFIWLPSRRPGSLPAWLTSVSGPSGGRADPAWPRAPGKQGRWTLDDPGLGGDLPAAEGRGDPSCTPG